MHSRLRYPLSGFVVAAVVAGFFLLPNVPAAGAVTTAELQQQLSALLQQVQNLQQQLQNTSQLQSGQQSLTLSFNLTRGSTDAKTNGEVSKLQRFLAQDKAIYPEGLITGYLGAFTERAVQRWQVKQGIVSSGSVVTTGYGAVGPKTREALRSSATFDLSKPTPPLPSPGRVIISSLSPSSGPPGTFVTITGGGFTSTGNTIYLGSTAIPNAASVNGVTLTFYIPSGFFACPAIYPPAGCIQGTPTSPGTYDVSVKNGSGLTSNTLTFTVTASATKIIP
ncbi:MAG: IPT/TIG domain-containing protein [Candidatus Colwellbacteria bacterium]|nr:IPT/TIG domain-containing protein [Candidatus Colwellbacteria bacterium]